MLHTPTVKHRRFYPPCSTCGLTARLLEFLVLWCSISVLRTDPFVGIPVSRYPGHRTSSGDFDRHRLSVLAGVSAQQKELQP